MVCFNGVFEKRTGKQTLQVTERNLEENDSVGVEGGGGRLGAGKEGGVFVRAEEKSDESVCDPSSPDNLH